MCHVEYKAYVEAANASLAVVVAKADEDLASTIGEYFIEMDAHAAHVPLDRFINKDNRVVLCVLAEFVMEAGLAPKEKQHVDEADYPRTPPSPCMSLTAMTPA